MFDVTRYVSKYMQPAEYLPRSIWATYGTAGRMFIDGRVLFTLDTLRERYKAPVVVNAYPWGGSSQWRGFRTHQCEVGASLSQHRFGRAADPAVIGYEAGEVRADIIKHRALYPFVTRVEVGVSHLHFDCANVEPFNDMQEVWEIRP